MYISARLAHFKLIARLSLGSDFGEMLLPLEQGLIRTFLTLSEHGIRYASAVSPPSRAQSLQKHPLRFIDSFFRLGQGEKFRAINLWKGLHSSRVGRPLHFKRVAGQRHHLVRPDLERPGVHGLAALLFYRPQIDQISLQLEADFLAKLARCRFQILAFLLFALWNAPGAFVFLFPNGPPGWISSTSSWPALCLYVKTPALVLAGIFN